MPTNRKRIYWDASAFISYFNGVEDRLPTLDALLDDARAEEILIVTSVVSIAEVVYSVDEEGQKQLTDESFGVIDLLLHDRKIISLVEVSPAIASAARNLIRDGLASGRPLTPMDALHLATAQLLEPAPAEIHTYDEEWLAWGDFLNIPVVKPRTESPRLLP